ncbi:hypothetical protein HYY71_03915 [Candidatus Woesearchaeota archaeon]|nr:hypothetical protein [Candidatus Woesearchaeota archaeon]
MKDKVISNNKDVLAIAAIFLLSLIFFWNIIGTGTVMNNGHYLHEQTFFTYNYKYALEHGTLPFWTPYWYSGQPLFGDSQVFFLNLTFIFMVLFRNVFLAIDLSTLIYFFTGGLGMYFLVKCLIESRSAAFISSIIFMFNGIIYTFVTSGNPSILEPYSLIPLIFLCLVKARNAKNPVNFSILAGVLLASQVLSGGAQVFLYTIVLVALYLAIICISSNFKKDLSRAFAIGLIVMIIFFGMSAVKLLPGLDFAKKTNRAEGVNYAEYLGGDQFVFRDFFKIMVFNIPHSNVYFGIAASVLGLSSLFFWRKRIVLFLMFVSVFILLLGSGGFLAKLFYNYVPVFSQTRHIGRSLFVFVFAFSVLAGYGFLHLSEFIAKKFKASGIMKNILFAALVLLILSELVFAKGIPQGLNIKSQLEQNELAKYLQEQKEKFRITTFDVDDIVSFYDSSYYAQYGLETISGGGGVWFNDITSYIAIAKNYNASKLLGLLNLKYAASTEIIDAPGFRLAKKFEECIPCNESGWTYWIDGPYLYENEDFMPRYYLVDNSVLILGDEKQAQQLAYGILLNRNFNPKNTVIIQGKQNVDEYGIDFLRKFNAIILLKGSVDGNSFRLLEQYKSSGGHILPDILSGENVIDISEIEEIMGSFRGSLVNVDFKTISQNEIELMPKNKGFLVLSERFSGFDDWRAESGEKQFDILKADGMISAVYVDSPSAINFKFLPKSFIAGLIISLSILLIIFIYGLLLVLKRLKALRKAKPGAH